ncbi:MAG: CsbD family protein [Nitrososphaerales archaeon]
MSNERIEGNARKEHGKVEEKLGKDYHDKGVEIEGKSEQEYGKAEEKVGKMNEKEEQKGRPTNMRNDEVLAPNLKKKVTITTEDKDSETKEEVIATIH